MTDKIKAGLWLRNNNGKASYNGSVKIGDQEYWVNVYPNEKKSDKHPDMTAYVIPKDGPRQKLEIY